MWRSKMEKHTKGPWSLKRVNTSAGTCFKIGVFPSLGVYDETSACVYVDNVREPDYGYSLVGDELAANAHLIAAAPELLEALESIENDDRRIPAAIWALRNAAIAKARGEK
jgi:hypothetical protein